MVFDKNVNSSGKFKHYYPYVSQYVPLYPSSPVDYDKFTKQEQNPKNLSPSCVKTENKYAAYVQFCFCLNSFRSALNFSITVSNHRGNLD